MQTHFIRVAKSYLHCGTQHKSWRATKLRFNMFFWLWIFFLLLDFIIAMIRILICQICSLGTVVRSLRCTIGRLPVLFQKACFCPSGESARSLFKSSESKLTLTSAKWAVHILHTGNNICIFCISCILFCIFCILHAILSKVFKTCILIAYFTYFLAYYFAYSAYWFELHIVHILHIIFHILHIVSHIIWHILHIDFHCIFCILSILMCILVAYLSAYYFAYLTYCHLCIFCIFGAYNAYF